MGKYLICDALHIDTTSVMYYGDSFDISKFLTWSESVACMRFDLGDLVWNLYLEKVKSLAPFVLVALRKCMKLSKKCPRDSASRFAPVWTVSCMRIPQCGPARTPPAPVCSALKHGGLIIGTRPSAAIMLLYVVCIRSVNSVLLSDTIWRHRSRSPLVQVMACCLMAPSHYLNQCWLLIIWGSMAFTWEEFNRKCLSYYSVYWVWNLYF